jgi:hypothetical protein
VGEAKRLLAEAAEKVKNKRSETGSTAFSTSALPVHTERVGLL